MKRKYSWPLIVACSLVLILLALVDAGRIWGQRAGDPTMIATAGGPYVYRLEINGEAVADYTECIGLGSSNEIDEAVRLTQTGLIYTEKTPGPLQWHNITLRGDSPNDGEVAAWRKSMEDMDMNRALRNGSILVLEAGSSDPVAEWAFVNGWAARLTFGESGEELVIVHEGIQRTDAGGSSTPPSRR